VKAKKKLSRKPLILALMAALAIGSASVLASPDDDRGNRSDDRGNSENRGGGYNRDDDDDDDDDRGGGGGGGGGGQRFALNADLNPIPPTAGRGFGQYYEYSGGEGTALNADVRLALEKLDDEGNTLKVFNTHLGITVDNYEDTEITLFIGTDEDGDGTCMTEGPTSICVLRGGGHEDLEVNDLNVLHAAWAITLREDDGDLRASGTCWSDFDSVEVIPQFTEDGTTMTSVVFKIEGGEEAMPEIKEFDGSIVGFGHPWLVEEDIFTESINCEADTTCEVIPVLNGVWDTDNSPDD
jgi:hypothetical protein